MANNNGSIPITGTETEINIQQLFISRVEIPNKCHIDIAAQIQEKIPGVQMSQKLARELSYIYQIEVVNIEQHKELEKFLNTCAKRRKLEFRVIQT